MLKGSIEYLNYLLLSTGRGVFIQVEKLRHAFFLAGGGKKGWNFKGIETLSVCFPRHRTSGPVPAVIRNAGKILTRSHPPSQKTKKTKQKKKKREQTRAGKGFPPFSRVLFNSPPPLSERLEQALAPQSSVEVQKLERVSRVRAQNPSKSLNLRRGEKHRALPSL